MKTVPVNTRNRMTMTNGMCTFHFYETDGGYFQCDDFGNRRKFEHRQAIRDHVAMYMNMGWWRDYTND